MTPNREKVVRDLVAALEWGQRPAPSDVARRLIARGETTHYAQAIADQWAELEFPEKAGTLHV